MDIDKLTEILMKNKEKNFVKRILNPEEYPVLDNPDGSTSTHSMAWGEDNEGKGYVYPTVKQSTENKLKRFSDEDAWKNAMETGDFIEFDSLEGADQFSREYKDYWKRDKLKEIDALSY